MSENSPLNNTFHLAITMAGAVSAGAYTAGVIDYLLETLDKWYDLKKEATEFFKNNDQLKEKTWSELEKLALDENTLKKAKLYNAIPTHDIQIEILSGASAGGMTAAITSFVLHQKNKHSVKRNSNEETKSRSRLFNSWVNVTGKSDMLPELLSDADINSNLTAPFPLSLFNSRFIREISAKSLKINTPSNIQLSPYVAPDFNLFVTLTNLKGFPKSIRVNDGGTKYLGDFITNDHRDLMMFDFCEAKTKGTINIRFKEQKNARMQENIALLKNAAVSTGAFPIGLEYGFIKREADYINHNFLLNQIYNNNTDLVTTFDDHSVFIDGGLINNEPFDLTKTLLIERLSRPIREEFDKQKTKKNPPENELSPTEIQNLVNTRLKAERYNRTILMIDPFPSEKKEEPIRDQNGQTNEYPYSFLGAIIQLLSTTRTQLLVKSDLIEKGFNEDNFECFLIAPRRRIYRQDQDGKLIKDNGFFKPEYETNELGELLKGIDEKPIPKSYDGSAAIACGTLEGFGGFLNQDFREHDFFLGRLNCKSFLRHHFRIETNKPSIVNDAYNGEAKRIFKITDTKFDENKNEISEYFLPLIPDVGIIEKLLAEKYTIEALQDRKDIDLNYGELAYPTYPMKQFQQHRKALKRRLLQVIYSIFKLFLTPFKFVLLKPIIWVFISVIYRLWAFRGICNFVKKDLETWSLIKKIF